MIYQLGNKRVQADPDTWIADSAHVMGDVVLMKGASVWFNAVLRGDNEYIEIGEGANVQDGAVPV